MSDSAMTFATRFSRITTSGRFIPEIDGLRFVAIAAVFLYHLEEYLHHFVPHADQGGVLTAIAHQGKNGVQLFFVISGLLLALPFARAARGQSAPVRLGSYLLRRVTRLEPPYLVNLVVMTAATLVAGKYAARDLAPHAAASAVYLHGLIFNHVPIVSTVAWSLEIEVQFYLLVPLLALVFRLPPVLRRALIVGAALLGGVLHLIPELVTTRIVRTPIYFMPYFGTGFMLADLLTTELRTTSDRASAWDAVAFIGWPLAFMATFSEWSIALLMPVCFGAVILGTMRGRAARWLLTRSTLTLIGGMCYTIYLYHYLIIGFFWKVAPRVTPFTNYEANLALQFAIVGAATFAICGLLFLLIERPCMRRDWPRRLAARIRTGVAMTDMQTVE